ncbi:hypothetical protein LTR53_016676, partial [Teratosphaeriaceae sp. CCFEE 6253]
GLTANGDEIRLLENIKDGLYLTTMLTNDVLYYPSLCSDVRSPVQAHSTVPVALAWSPSYVVSASDHPPVVYVKNVARGTQSILLHPRISGNAVRLAAFHPEKDSVFLLGFKDGTIAAYNANNASDSGHDGEIGHLRQAHIGATCAVFIPGAKASVLSVGKDARCRLIDLSDEHVVRTWHGEAPLTSVCACDGLIAVGRIDGRVRLYDLDGVLQAERSVAAERIIAVEWVRGPVPYAISGKPSQDISGAPSSPAPNMLSSRRGPGTGGENPTVRAHAVDYTSRRSQQSVGLGLPPALKRPATTLQTARPDKRFTVHPDEAEEGTVRRTPHFAAAPSAPRPVELPDLFSPARSAGPADAFGTAAKRCATSPRQRPRISTQTFVQSPAIRRTVSHATSSGFANSPPRNLSATTTFARARRTSARVSPGDKRRISFQPVHSSRGQAGADGNTLGDSQADPPSANAGPLVGLREPTISRAVGYSVPGVYTASAKSQKRDGSVAATATAAARLPAPHQRDGLGKQKAWHPGNVLEREDTWPTDSVQDGLEDDTWLTDKSDQETGEVRHRRLVSFGRLPARQPSRSKQSHADTYSTAPDADPRAPVSWRLRQGLDGSTEESAFDTAFTHLSPSGTFAPASAAVRELFPRTSSLSPTRKAALRRPKSPWEKAKARKGRQSAHAASTSKPPPKQEAVSLAKSPGMKCAECDKSCSRLLILEDEVARLKDEMIATQAVLRRSGVVPCKATRSGIRDRARAA